jgi:hypothetical protein
MGHGAAIGWTTAARVPVVPAFDGGGKFSLVRCVAAYWWWRGVGEKEGRGERSACATYLYPVRARSREVGASWSTLRRNRGGSSVWVRWKGRVRRLGPTSQWGAREPANVTRVTDIGPHHASTLPLRADDTAHWAPHVRASGECKREAVWWVPRVSGSGRGGALVGPRDRKDQLGQKGCGWPTYIRFVLVFSFYLPFSFLYF